MESELPAAPLLGDAVAARLAAAGAGVVSLLLVVTPGGGLFLASLTGRRRRGETGPAFHLGDPQVELSPRHVDLDHDDLDHVADADLPPRALAADLAAALVDVPPVVEQVLVPDQAVDEPLGDLDEHAEVGDARDDAVEFFADVALEQLEDLDLAELALGFFASALGEADVFAELDERVVAGDVVEGGFGFSSAADAALRPA